MQIKEYLANMKEVNIASYSPKKDLSIKFLLIAPIKRKEGASFILVLGGSFFAHLPQQDGIIFNEFIKLVNKKLYPILDKKTLPFILDELERNVKKLQVFDSTLVIKDTMVKYLEEINRYMSGERLTKVFNKVYPYEYSIHYKRPCKIQVISNLKPTSLHEMHEILSSLEYQNILLVEYPSIVVKDDNFKNYLSDKESFYNVLKSDGKFIQSKDLQKYKEAGLDQIIIPANSMDINIENKLSSNSIKDIVTMVKNAISLGIKVTIETKVTIDNEEYINLLKAFHLLGVRSFIVSFDSKVENKTQILKQAYYYANMYSLEFILNTKGVLKEKELKKMAVYPSYKDEMAAMYYATGDFSLYADKELKNRLGSLSMEKIEAVYDNSKAKKLRKDALKRK